MGNFSHGERQTLLAGALSNAVCNYMNDTLRRLSDEGKVVMSLGDPSTPDRSLLSETGDFWGIYIPTADEGMSGFYLLGGGGGGELPPQTLQFPPQRTLPIGFLNDSHVAS